MRAAAGPVGIEGRSIGHRKQVRIGCLHFGEIGSGFHHAPNPVFVKFIRGGARSAAAQIHAHRERIVFFGDILRNPVVGEARKRAWPPPISEFGFVGLRVLQHTRKSFLSFFFREHSK